MKKLLGVGGSDDSFTALDHTVERVKETGDSLVVAVVDNPDSPRSVDDVERRVLDVLDDAGVDVEVEVVEGHPGSELIEMAETGGFDEIVLGGGQRSTMDKIRVGEIAEFVLLNSRVSVKLVR